MYTVIMAVMLLLCGGSVFGIQKDQSLFRDLIIVLDDTVETNPGKIGAQIYTLQEALQAEAAPILVSTSLWQTFIEARQEWQVRAQISDTNEQKSVALMNNINERINYWHNILCGSLDDIHVRALIANKISEEFYTKERYEQLISTGVIPKNMQSLWNIALCITNFCDFDAWYWFYLDTGYYLALPKKYCARFTDATNLSDLLTTAGLNPSIAVNAIDPLVIDPLYSMHGSYVNETIIPTLQKILQPKKNSAQTDYLWSLYVKGHGCNNNSMQGPIQEVAGITLSRFKELCIFFDTHLSMHVLWAISCNAGGINRLALSCENVYNYPIIIECLGDTSAYNNLDAFNSLPDGKWELKGYHLKKNPTTQRWEFYCKPSRRFKRFFRKMHTLSNVTTNNDCISTQEIVYAAYEMISPKRYVSNIPHLLVPNSNQWLLCYPAYMTYLNVQSALLMEVCNLPQGLRTEYLLVDAPVFSTGWKLVDKRVQYIVPMSPGDTTHYCSSLQASEYVAEALIGCLWPPFKQSCTKQLLFDTISCACDPQDPLTQMLGITEKTVTFTQVIIQIIKNEQIKILFTTPQGDTFNASMREIDGKRMIRNMQKLSAEATTSYHAYYEKTKLDLIRKSAEAYAPLRAKYTAALQANAVAQAA